MVSLIEEFSKYESALPTTLASLTKQLLQICKAVAAWDGQAYVLSLWSCLKMFFSPFSAEIFSCISESFLSLYLGKLWKNEVFKFYLI